MWQPLTCGIELGINVDHQYSADQAQWQNLFYNVEYQDMMGVTQVGPGYDPDPYTYHGIAL
ncbi:MAG: hypothetical protein U5Q44_07830 [Dehalococcoidia bacterium]|nr:hypothetical protein [Dehalococcoidia bacterium]